MAEFLTTSDVTARVNKLIRDAQEELILVSPYLKIPPVILQRLREVDQRGVGITMLYGKEELKIDQRIQLKGLSGLKLVYLENLHAKCYCNEYSMVITSMNLYQYSATNNREMGVYVAADEQLYRDARREIESFLSISVERAHPDRCVQTLVEESRYNFEQQSQSSQRNSNGRSRSNSTRSRSRYDGHCIRCAEDIVFNRERPYCKDCYSVWAKWSNPDYEESVCHHCCQGFESTMNRPLWLGLLRSSIGKTWQRLNSKSNVKPH